MPHPSAQGVVEYSPEEKAPEIDRDVFLKLHMLDDAGSEVIAGTGPAQRWLDNRDLGEEMRIVTVRRENRGVPDAFAAVYEPYRGKPFIRGVSRVAVTPGDAEGVGMMVAHRRGTDLILSAGRPGVRQMEAGGHTLCTDGELAVASFDEKGVRSLSVIGGTFAQADGQRAEVRPTWEGLLAGFDDVGKTLSVKPEVGTGNGDRAGRDQIIRRGESRVRPLEEMQR